MRGGNGQVEAGRLGVPRTNPATWSIVNRPRSERESSLSRPPGRPRQSPSREGIRGDVASSPHAQDDQRRRALTRSAGLPSLRSRWGLAKSLITEPSRLGCRRPRQGRFGRYTHRLFLKPCMLKPITSTGQMETAVGKLAERQQAFPQRPATDRSTRGPTRPWKSGIVAGFMRLARTAARAVVAPVAARARIRKDGTSSWTSPSLRSWESTSPNGPGLPGSYYINPYVVQSLPRRLP